MHIPTIIETSQLTQVTRDDHLMILVSYNEVDPDETILSKALDSGLTVPHDCKPGVCITCPAKLLGGSVDQSEGMLSDDVVERGFALLCAAYPHSDCHIKTIPEEELLSMQLATADD
ncbi:hypothetical protein LWI28_000694 [Acer negundo]|uniref:2Fe-2S ferredoxin-type domain-containing protein n=1 Tax=Acer negundo TaxID=4023 RepID=A0AAD5JF12_ACENE|nr:hypothetical protein LWI28_000694 [Acer negundo]